MSMTFQQYCRISREKRTVHTNDSLRCGSRMPEIGNAQCNLAPVQFTVATYSLGAVCKIRLSQPLK